MSDNINHLARDSVQKIPDYTPGHSIAAIKQETGQSSFIKLASNENPLGCSLSKDELTRCFIDSDVYPDINTHPLLESLSKKHQVSINQLILGNGSDEIFQTLALAFLNPNDSVLSAEHTFSVYKSATVLMGATYIPISMKHYAYDYQAIYEAITDQTKLIFIANPNNPTGSYLSYDELSSFLSQIPNHVIVVLDEAYKDYVETDPLDSNLTLLHSYPNLIITRTFSKIYGLAGLRIGYGMAHESLIRVLKKVRLPFNANIAALNAAHLALETKADFVRESQVMNQRGYALYKDAAASWPVQCLPSSGNFVCLVMTQHSAEDAFNHCLNHGFIIRKLTSFGLPNAIRITIGKPNHNDDMIACLNQFFGSTSYP